MFFFSCGECVVTYDKEAEIVLCGEVLLFMFPGWNCSSVRKALSNGIVHYIQLYNICFVSNVRSLCSNGVIVI